MPPFVLAVRVTSGKASQGRANFALPLCSPNNEKTKRNIFRCRCFLSKALISRPNDAPSAPRGLLKPSHWRPEKRFLLRSAPSNIQEGGPAGQTFEP